MAWLLTPDGSRITLRGRHLIGRSRAMDLVLAANDVSAEHAVIAWDGDRWALRDLGSRNGTWHNDARLKPGQTTSLSVGDQVRFGLSTDTYLLQGLSPPGPAARAGDDVLEGLGSWLPLPSADSPEAMVVADDDAGWVLLRDDTTTPVRSGDVVTICQREWTLDLPQSLDSTLEKVSVEDDLELRFRVSSDEEFVEVDVVLGGVVHSLKPRAHQYVLLTLARLRCDDMERGLEPAEQGWVGTEQLCDMLRMPTTHLHVALYRARQELAGIGVPHARDLIERRSTSRALRLGVASLSVQRLG